MVRSPSHPSNYSINVPSISPISLKGFKVALGIINLHRKYGEERLQRACGRALEFRYHSYKAVKNILANGLDKIEPEQLSANQPSLPLHANIRGNDYYHFQEER